MENETLIRQCLEGNPADAQNTFNRIMQARIADSLETRTFDISQSIYAPETE